MHILKYFNYFFFSGVVWIVRKRMKVRENSTFVTYLFVLFAIKYMRK